MSDREKLRLELERRMFTLVGALEAQIDRENLDLLRDFVENRESGVALEWLDSLAFERAIPLLPEQRREMRELATMMGLDPDGLRSAKA
jgi:hypothetical protein